MEFKTLKELHGKKEVKEEIKKYIESNIDFYNLRPYIKNNVKKFGFNLTIGEAFTVQAHNTKELESMQSTALALICKWMYFAGIKVKDLRD